MIGLAKVDKGAAYMETLATMRRDLTEVEGRARQLREAIKVIEQLVPQEDLFPDARVAAKVARNGLSGLSMVDAAERVLKDAGRPLHIMQIVNEMLGRGFPYDKDPDALRASLTGSIERKKNVFRRGPPATYGLTVWSTEETANEKAKLKPLREVLKEREQPDEARPLTAADVFPEDAPHRSGTRL